MREDDRAIPSSGPGRVIAFCAIGMILGLGTCGIGGLIGDERGTPVILAVGSIVFFGSLLGLCVAGVIALLRRRP